MILIYFFSSSGLTVGVGVVWFLSVVSEEYAASSGRRTTWVTMYAYKYGWAVVAAGGAGIGAFLAALLTGHSHLVAHSPVTARPTSFDEGLARPLLR